MIVIDASAAIAGLINDGAARARMVTESLHAPHLIDVEVAHVLRRLAMRSEISAGEAALALKTWAQLGVRRYGVTAVLGRIWELRNNLSAYDAAYVSLAEALGCDLMTADSRLAHSAGPRCLLHIVAR